MRNVKISVCQFRVEKVSGFDQFGQQVKTLMNNVPNEYGTILGSPPHQGQSIERVYYMLYI